MGGASGTTHHCSLAWKIPCCFFLTEIPRRHGCDPAWFDRASGFKFSLSAKAFAEPSIYDMNARVQLRATIPVRTTVRGYLFI